MAPGSSEHQPYQFASGNPGWIEVTEIDDDDLQFGGKSLSEWYEEERRRLSHCSSSSDEEERRGRQRVRRHYASHHNKKHVATADKR